MYDFAYSRPGSVAEAVRALGADSDAKPLAGGQTLIPVLKQRLNRPSTVLDLSGLGLDGVRREGYRIVIGAMATHRDIAASPEVRQAIPGLAKMARLIGDTQVRHRGTIGGSLANNDPSACYPAAVLALALTPLVRRVVLRYEIVDRPEARRVNTIPVPRGGGLAVCAAFLAVSSAFLLVNDGGRIVPVPLSFSPTGSWWSSRATWSRRARRRSCSPVPEAHSLHASRA